MPFIENQGQIADEQVRFYAKTFGGAIYVTKEGEMVYSFIKSESNHNPKKRRIETKPDSETTQIITFKEKLVGASTRSPEGSEKGETKVNYFVGNDPNKWKTNLSTYEVVSLGEVYQGIDLRLKAYGKNVEKIFAVKPGADPGAIKLKIDRGAALEINENGELEVDTGLGVVSFAKPLAYQEINGKRQEVKVAYLLKNSELRTPNPELAYGFEVLEYDKSVPLIIDPVLAYSTYLGGSGGDSGYGIAVDGSGNIYITGTTASTNFRTVGPIQASNAGSIDVFVTKINAPGNALVYSTYLGGGGDDYGDRIAVDGSGNVYLTGYTTSTDFPTVSASQPTYRGGTFDAFVTKINASGNALVYSTYLGGSGADSGNAIAVDGSGNVYLTGTTSSINFPTSEYPVQNLNAGGSDAFVSKIDASGTLVYSTYLGGNGDDYGFGIAADTFRNIYVTGRTKSTDFPGPKTIQSTPFPSVGGGYWDAFVAKIDASGTFPYLTLVYSTYLGGDYGEDGYAIAVDSSQNVYITGTTHSTNFPTVNSIQASNAGASDCFVTKINPAGSTFVYSTYLGGNFDDVCEGIAVDGSGNVYITGSTISANFPTSNPIQINNAGLVDVFVTKINPAGSALVYSTYLGGSGEDQSRGIAVDGSGNVYLAGSTSSTNFPISSSPIQGSNAGGTDVFVAKIGDRLLTVTKSGTGTGTVTSSLFGINCGPVCTNAQSSFGDGDVVTLTAAPAAGSYFGGWSGDCVSQALTCKVTMDAAKNVTATFTTTPPPVTTWAKTYGAGGDDYANSIQQTSDGGYIVAGASYPGASGYSYGDLWVLKLRIDGTVDWQKTYGGSDVDFGGLIQQTADGGYIVAGTTYSFGAGNGDLWVLKLFSDGTEDWQKAYGGSGNDSASSIQQTSDGGYIVTGTTYSFGAGNGDLWVLKLKSDGTVDWEKTYAGYYNRDSASSVQQTSDGGYIVAGSSEIIGTGFDIWVLKLNGEGAVDWQKTYGGSADDYASSIQQTSDGGYILAGYTVTIQDETALVMKLDSGGNVLWGKTYDGPGDEYASSVQQTADGGYIVTGTIYPGSHGNTLGDLWVLKMRNDGTVDWQKTYGGSGNDSASSIQQTSDGGYIVAGGTKSFGAGMYDFWVLKLDSNGNISGCPGGVIGASSAAEGSPTITVTSPTLTIGNSSASIYDVGITNATTTVTAVEVCTGIPCSFSISPTSDYYPSGGGNGSVNVIAPIGCSWSAYSNDSWIIRTSLPDGSGNGTVSYLVAINSPPPGPLRTGTMTIAGHTFTVYQDAFDDPDSDHDGLSDAWEMAYFGNLNQGASGDPDGDGYSNAREFALGTEPNNPSSYPTSYVPDAERNALIDLYNSTNGDGWTNQTNWLSMTVSECVWYGVSCTGNHVVQLDLTDANTLIGTIPLSIGNLTNLELLALDNNQLAGSIPAQLGSLANLQYLALGNNQLTGSIPDQLGSLTSLRELYLGENQLTGSIPASLGNLTSLYYLNLQNNQLAGNIPTSLGNLTSLYILNLQNNQLTGSIPPQFGNLTYLQRLLLYNNQLTGNIPSGLGNLVNLEELYLYNNQLTGNIPPELGNLWNFLYLLILDNNQLTGSIPSELGNLTNLQYLSLVSNKLTGAIPASLTKLTGLVDNNSDLRWNALYTTDSTLRTFLNQKQYGGNWESTQTVAPTNLTATVLSSTSVQLTWIPIAYMGDSGGYEIWKGTPGPGGTVWSLEYTTPNKSTNAYTVGGLTPGILYDFKLRTVTNSHPNNQNTVYSEYSLPTSGDEFTGDLIDRTVWVDLEVFRRVNNGVLESELRRHGSNASNYLHFYDPDTINSFQADVIVKAYENNGSYPHASLLSYTYNDGSPGDGATGDVVGVVGIGHNGTELEGFYSISRCIAPNCNLPNEIQPICSGRIGLAALNTTYPLSFAWNDLTSTFTFTFGAGAPVNVNSSNCPLLPSNVGHLPPKVELKGIGTRIVNITTGSQEGGFIAATFDNVYKNGSSYDTFDSSTIDLTKWWGTLELVRMVDNGSLVSELTQRGVNGTNNMSLVDSQHILGFEADLKVVEFQNSGARPLARLYASLYNDGTGNSTPGDLTGDVNVAVGISGQGSNLQAFFAVTRCLANNCNLAG